MANIAATKLLNSLFAGQSPSEVETQNLELILRLMAATGGNDTLTGPAEVVRRAKSLVGNSLAVQRLEYLLQTQADKEARQLIADVRIQQGSGHKLADRVAASIVTTLKRRTDWRRIAIIVAKRLQWAATDYQPPEQMESD